MLISIVLWKQNCLQHLKAVKRHILRNSGVLNIIAIMNRTTKSIAITHKQNNKQITEIIQMKSGARSGRCSDREQKVALSFVWCLNILWCFCCRLAVSGRVRCRNSSSKFRWNVCGAAVGTDRVMRKNTFRVSFSCSNWSASFRFSRGFVASLIKNELNLSLLRKFDLIFFGSVNEIWRNKEVGSTTIEIAMFLWLCSKRVEFSLSTITRRTNEKHKPL